MSCSFFFVFCCCCCCYPDYFISVELFAEFPSVNNFVCVFSPFRYSYVVKTLEQFVTEDYILIYLHGASTRSTIPPLPWLKKCYYLLDRRIRKSLRNVYMVHPTFWLKSVVWMSRPFISSKFWRKLVYIRTLDDLYKHVPVEKPAIPDKVKIYDKKNLP